MKAIVIYANWDLLDEVTLWAVMGTGKIIFNKPDLYYKVHVFEYHNGPVGPLDACEEMFALFTMPGGLQEKKGIRSMSVGDVVIIQDDQNRTEPYGVGHLGFTDMSHEPNSGSWLERLLG